VLEGRAKTGTACALTPVERAHAIAHGPHRVSTRYGRKSWPSPPKRSEPPRKLGRPSTRPELQDYFVKSGRYNPRVSRRHYPPPATVLTAEATQQNLAKGFTIGTRFPLRTCRAPRPTPRPMHLGHAAPCRWCLAYLRLLPTRGGTASAQARRTFLAESPNSPIRRFTPAGGEHRQA